MQNINDKNLKVLSNNSYIRNCSTNELMIVNI